MGRNFGILVTPDIKLQRKYFKEMTSLLGVNVQYQYPLSNKQYNLQGELDSSYSSPIVVSCIFEETLNQSTAKKLGWIAELQEDKAVIHVPFELEHLQVGCLFTIPSAFGDSRKFRVTRLSAEMIYPASISCELVPEYDTNVEKSETQVFKNSDFNLLNEGD